MPPIQSDDLILNDPTLNRRPTLTAPYYAVVHIFFAPCYKETSVAVQNIKIQITAVHHNNAVLWKKKKCPPFYFRVPPSWRSPWKWVSDHHSLVWHLVSRPSYYSEISPIASIRYTLRLNVPSFYAYNIFIPQIGHKCEIEIFRQGIVIMLIYIRNAQCALSPENTNMVNIACSSSKTITDITNRICKKSDKITCSQVVFNCWGLSM